MNNKKDEKSIIDLIHLVKKKLNDLRIDDSLNDPKLKEAFRRAKPVHWSELTEDEQEAYLIEQAEATQEFDREQKILKFKQLFQTIMKATCDKSDLRLFTTAKELLEFVVKYESNPSSVSNYEWNRFVTVSFTEFEALLLAAGKEEKPTETEAETNDKHGEDTLYDRVIKRCKNNPVICVILICLVVLGGLGFATDSYNKIYTSWIKPNLSPMIEIDPNTVHIN